MLCLILCSFVSVWILALKSPTGKWSIKILFIYQPIIYFFIYSHVFITLFIYLFILASLNRILHTHDNRNLLQYYMYVLQEIVNPIFLIAGK